MSLTASEASVVTALYPGLGLALDAAVLHLKRRDRLHTAERGHAELGTVSKRSLDRAIAQEAQSAAALEKAISDWRNSQQ